MNRTTRYLIIVCGLSWGLIGGSYALGLKWQGVNMMLLGMVLKTSKTGLAQHTQDSWRPTAQKRTGLQ